MDTMEHVDCQGTMCGRQRCRTCYPQQNSALQHQIGGGHYKHFKIQPIEFAFHNRLDTCQANVVKYVTRFRDKHGIEDLRKARHYLELLAQLEYKEVL